MAPLRYENSVFINCPFDSGYDHLFQAIVFAVHACGFAARCSLEASDSGEARIRRIVQIISECRLGIHDISRTELDNDHGLPRFNMPLELGLFLGAKSYGAGRQKGKICLILDRDLYRYQRFCSDIAGHDIRAHNNEPEEAIRRVRDWLRDIDRGAQIPGGSQISKSYQLFKGDLPVLCSTSHLTENELTFNDLTTVVEGWLRDKLP